MEQLADVLLLEVDGGHHDVAGRLPQELDDALAEVGIDDLDPPLDEVGVQVAFLGEHRLALHQALDAVVAQDPVDDPVVLVRVARPVHVGAESTSVAGRPRMKSRSSSTATRAPSASPSSRCPTATKRCSSPRT